MFGLDSGLVGGVAALALYWLFGLLGAFRIYAYDAEHDAERLNSFWERYITGLGMAVLFGGFFLFLYSLQFSASQRK